MSDHPDNVGTLDEAIKGLHKTIVDHEVRSRQVIYKWLTSVYQLLVHVEKSTKLQEELITAYKRAFKTHPRTSSALRIVKLCVCNTETPEQTAHRWSKVLDAALERHWAPEELGAKLQDMGVEGILRDDRGLTEQARTALGADESSEEPVIETDLEGLSSIAEQLEDSIPYVLLVIRQGARLKVTAKFQPTPSQLQVIRRIQMARGQTSIKSPEFGEAAE